MYNPSEVESEIERDCVLGVGDEKEKPEDEREYEGDEFMEEQAKEQTEHIKN